MVLFKDIKEINHRNPAKQKENLKKIVEIVNERNSGKREKTLLNDTLIGIDDEKEHNPERKGCSSILSSKDRKTEKRICRCMYYYDKENENCKSCCSSWKKEIKGDYIISDYEIPMENVIKGIGGIDLRIRNKKTETYYLTEFKSKDSKESLARMFAEILTYKLFCNSEYKNDKPAICFVKGSIQEKDFYEKEYQEEINKICKEITVFCINVDEDNNEYSIEKLAED